jgi:hypothetical protein
MPPAFAELDGEVLFRATAIGWKQVAADDILA